MNCWLIEVGQTPYYVTGFVEGQNSKTIIDANPFKALQYATKEDAETTIDFWKMKHARAVEHSFEEPSDDKEGN